MRCCCVCNEGWAVDSIGRFKIGQNWKFFLSKIIIYSLTVLMIMFERIILRMFKCYPKFKMAAGFQDG